MAKQKKEEYFDFVDSGKLNYQRFTGIYYCTTNSEAIARLIEDIHDIKYVNIKKQLTKIMNEIKGRDIDAEDFAIRYSAGFTVECCKQNGDSRYERYKTIDI